MNSPAPKPDYFRLACLFLAPQVPQSKIAKLIDEEEAREIIEGCNVQPQSEE